MDSSPLPGPGYLVLWYVLGLTGLSVAWYLLRGLARRHLRNGSAVAPSVRWYRRLAPTVAAARVWVAQAPATFTYMAIWTVISVLQQTSPQLPVQILVQANSTNLLRMFSNPVQVLFNSAFLVADKGIGFIGYVVVFVLAGARFEHRMGPARTIVVMACAHVVGTILSTGLDILLLRLGAVSPRVAYTEDVGISYAMYGVLAGYALFVSRRRRPWYVGGLVASLVVSVVFASTPYDFGHVFAAAVGLLVSLLALRSGSPRPDLRWRELVRGERQPAG